MTRINDLSLTQKATLVTGAGYWRTHEFPEAGIASAFLSDGPHGLRYQDEAGGADHLGLSDSSPATALPAEAATASTWNPTTMRALGEVLAFDAQRFGVDVVLGPGVNIKRAPLGGRNFEYLSEDPHLTGVLGAAIVRGLEDHGVGASVKHFAANNQETDRMRVSAHIDERTLREIYLAAFEHIVTTAKPSTLMCSYNKINGVKASEDHWLQTEVLRTEWGFEGYVMSDWGATDDMVASVAAGVDLTMPAAGQHQIDAVVAAVQNGALAEEDLTRACERIVATHERLRAARRPVDGMTADSAHAIARAAAAESIVMLKNDAGVLPLHAEGGAIALIGEFARTPRFRGGGSSQVIPTRLETALDALTAATGREVVFTPGFTMSDDDAPELRAQAVAAASAADVTVLMLGLPDSYESEGFDRAHMNLPAVQLTLLEAVAEVAGTLVVVLTNGAVVDTSEITPRADAILEAWIGGQGAGAALVDVLTGAVEPGGRLAETIPTCLKSTPAYLNWPGVDQHVNYGERVYVGYRYYDTLGIDVAYPFGFGLSYTTFERSAIAVAVPDPTTARAVVTVTVTNTGDRLGSDVVQVYVAHPGAGIDRPAHELRGFAKVTLEPGEARTISVELGDRAFAYWRDGWVVEPGEYVIEVGASSRDIYAAHPITLEVPAIVRALTVDSTFEEWMANEEGAALLLEALKGAGGFARAAMADPDMAAVLGGMPLPKLVAMSAIPTDPTAVVEGMLAQLEK